MRALFAAGLLALSQSAAQSDTGTIDGFVRRVGTLEPIPNVQVLLTQSSIANASHNTTTDSQGRYAFQNVKPGRYSVVARRDGFFPSGRTDVFSAAVAINVERQQRLTGLTLHMVPGGSIAGRIRGNGQPHSGAQVEALQLVYDIVGRRLVRSVKSVNSDGGGEYRLEGLAPGEYYIRARVPIFSGRGAPQQFLLRRNASQPATYFPSTFDVLSSTSIKLKGGSEIVAIDIALLGGPDGFSVSGTVINAVPEGLRQGDATTTLHLVPHATVIENPPGTGSSPNTTVDPASGRFEISSVPPGQYDLYAAIRMGAQGGLTRPPIFVGHALVNVRNENLPGLTITVRPGVEVRGRLTVNGEAPNGRVGDARVGWASTDGLPGSLLYVGEATPLAMVDPVSGDFVMKNIPPGTYRFSYGTTVPAGTYVLDARMNNRSVWDNEVSIGDESPGFLEVLVRVPGGIVEGVVSDGEKRPAAGAGIALVPQERRQTAALYKFATTDKDGRFTLRAIAPGEYKLFAMEAFSVDMWMNPDFRSAHESLGTAISVGVGNPATVRLTLIPE